MLKRLFLALAFAGLLSPAYSAGTVPGYGPSQQLDNLGKPLANCFLYTIQAGTVSTPQNAYQDSGLTLVLPNPQRCDAAGRLPQFFLADGSIKIRLTDSNGVTIINNDGILVVGASSGGGGGSPVDPTTILTTGDLKVSYGVSVLSGFVRANGRTIGSATSGATERANADTQALFQYLWGADANLVVSTGRGASAAADWAANKTIALPDWRGRALAGLDDMGATAAGRLTAAYFGAAGTTLGAAGGAESKAVLQANLPNVNFANSGITVSSVLGLNYFTGNNTGGSQQVQLGTVGVGTAGTLSLPSQNGATAGFSLTTSVSAQGAAASGGSGTALAVASPMMLATVYVKL